MGSERRVTGSRGSDSGWLERGEGTLILLLSPEGVQKVPVNEAAGTSHPQNELREGEPCREACCRWLVWRPLAPGRKDKAGHSESR